MRRLHQSDRIGREERPPPALTRIETTPNRLDVRQLDYEGSSVRGQLSIVVPGAALATSPLARGGPGLDGTLVVDAGHAQLQPLLPLCDREPELAAYALLKLVLLGNMTADRDSALLAGAMEARWQRTKS